MRCFPACDCVLRLNGLERWQWLVFVFVLFFWKRYSLSTVTADSHNTHMTVIGLPPLPASSYLSMVTFLACHISTVHVFRSDVFVFYQGNVKTDELVRQRLKYSQALYIGLSAWYVMYPLMKLKNVTENRLSHIQLFPKPIIN